MYVCMYCCKSMVYLHTFIIVEKILTVSTTLLIVGFYKSEFLRNNI